MLQLVAAIPRVQELLDSPVIVGGLAVMSRLGNAYRVTKDLDALRKRPDGELGGLEVLKAAGAQEVDEVGGFVDTERGLVRVDVLEAGPHDLDREFSDATDRLEATAHAWALRTASPVLLRAADIVRTSMSGPSADMAEAVALVARPGPLVAMKLKASMDRGAAKEATDLLDVVRLVTDPATAGLVVDEFEKVDAQLREDVRQHSEHKFVAQSLQTRRLINELNDTAVDDELIDAAAAFLRGVLT